MPQEVKSARRAFMPKHSDHPQARLVLGSSGPKGHAVPDDDDDDDDTKFMTKWAGGDGAATVGCI